VLSSVTVHVKKITPTFGMFFRNVFAAQLHRKSEGFFHKSETSSEERLVRTHISFWNMVQLCLRIFCVFRSCICNGKAENSNRNGFHKRASFLL